VDAERHTIDAVRGAARWPHTVRLLARKFADDQIPGRAAQMSFYFFLSLFPTLLILVAALSRFLDAQSLVREAILARLEAIAPGSIVEVFTSVLDHLADQAGAPVTWGIVVVLWAASSGMPIQPRTCTRVGSTSCSSWAATLSSSPRRRIRWWRTRCRRGTVSSARLLRAALSRHSPRSSMRS
jgi:hypothetical protein